MTSPTQTPPDWFLLSHHERYERLNKVRHEWCERPARPGADAAGRMIHLNGKWITDVPSLHLALGEAVNGPNGYFGGDLDALNDCFCGGFGVLPPLTVTLSHFDDVRAVLGGRVWFRFHAEICRRSDDTKSLVAANDSLVDCGYFGDGSPADIAKWTAIYQSAIADETFDSSDHASYFDAFVEILERRKVTLLPVYFGRDAENACEPATIAATDSNTKPAA